MPTADYTADAELVRRLRSLEHAAHQLSVLTLKIANIEHDLHNRAREIEKRVRVLEDLILGRHRP